MQLHQSYIRLHIHNHRRSNSTWIWLLVSCGLFTIACVHLDHAFPFDLTQLYSTSNKDHSNTITVSSMEHYTRQKISSQPRRRTKTKSTTTITTPTPTTTATPVTTESFSQMTLKTPKTPKTTPIPISPNSPSSANSPTPPYAMKEFPSSKLKAATNKAKAAQKRPEKESAESFPVTMIIQNHKQQKITPFPKQSDIVVETKYGSVKGMTGTVMGKDVSAFLGIRYAKPPLRGLRYRKTLRPEQWTATLLTQSFKPHCVQEFREDILLSRSLTTLIMSEDCLYLNIWSADISSAQLKPVLVWIYGGGFKGGTANLDETDGRVLAALGDVVVVTFNFRIGALGFLDLQSEEAPGNQGLYDIVEVLKFLQENIDKFGGDASRITLVGQDSGAVTAGSLLFSPIANKLFNRVIMQSGSPLFQDYFEGKNLKSSEKFTKELDCASCVTLKDKLKCLRGKTITEVLSVQKPLLKNDHHLFGPTFCQEILPESVLNSIQNEETDLTVKEVLLGSNRDELSLSLILDYPDIFNRRKINLNITKLQELRALIVKIFANDMYSESIRYLVDFFFTGGEENDSTENLIRRMYQIFGDAAVGCPVNIFAEQLVRRGKKVFLYEFNQRAQNSPWGSWMGVPMFSEVPYVFGHPLRYPQLYSQEDLTVSKRMIAIWSQFATNGTVPDQLDQKWEPFSEARPSFLEINARESVYGSRTHNGVCNIFRMALRARNETSLNCASKVASYDDNIDLESDLYETTTATASGMTEELPIESTTEPGLVSCPLLANDPEGPSVDYFNYQVIDLKIVPIVGAKAIFYCDSDMELIGEQIITCSSNGTWSSEIPSCRRPQHGHHGNGTMIPTFSCDFFREPLDDERLRVIYENLYVINETLTFAIKGSLARFKCIPIDSEDKVQLLGQEIVECSKYGIWSAIEPQCQVVRQSPEGMQVNFEDKYFLIGLLFVITFSLIFLSYLLYSKLSIREYSVEKHERESRRKVLKMRKSLVQLPFEACREESELLRVNQQSSNGSELSPEDLEVISILSKSRYGTKQAVDPIKEVDCNMNLMRSGSSSRTNDETRYSTDDESGSSPETVLWVHR